MSQQKTEMSQPSTICVRKSLGRKALKRGKIWGEKYRGKENRLMRLAHIRRSGNLLQKGSYRQEAIVWG